MRRLVEEQRIPIDVGDYDARTPLHLASGEGRQVYISATYHVPHHICASVYSSRGSAGVAWNCAACVSESVREPRCERDPK